MKEKHIYTGQMTPSEAAIELALLLNEMSVEFYDSKKKDALMTAIHILTGGLHPNDRQVILGLASIETPEGW